MQRTDTRRFTPSTGIIWQRLARWALIVAVAGLGLAYPVAAQSAGAQQPGKLDRFLEQHVPNAPDDEGLKVIITVRPGARKGIYAKLRAHGATVSHDFGIIEAVAAELPAGLSRSLAKDKDVVAISYDHEVTSMALPVGTVYTVTTTSNSGAGTLRQANIDANAHAGPDTIRFNIGSGAKTITVTSALPSITGTVRIEATRDAFGVTPSPNVVKAQLMHSAFPMSDADEDPYDVLTQGAGALNTAGALTLAAAIDVRMPTGSDWLVTGVTEATTIDGQSIVWGSSIVWGANYNVLSVDGQDVVWGNLATALGLWSTSTTWGSAIK